MDGDVIMLQVKCFCNLSKQQNAYKSHSCCCEFIDLGNITPPSPALFPKQMRGRSIRVLEVLVLGLITE